MQQPVGKVADLATRAAATPGVLAVALSLGGCGEWQSALHPHGDVARTILSLFWLFLGVAALVWLLVAAATVWAGLRRRRPAERRRRPLDLDPRFERKAVGAVGTAAALTVAILAGLTLASFLAGRSNAALSGAETVTVRLVGHQWWWEVRYPGAEQAPEVVSANEVHVPAGEPVRIELDSADVIHSFWVPSLAGKRDLIPGRPSELTLEVDKPGTYRGQCAEFCGYQHAHMALTVIAQGRPAFEAWKSAQAAEAKTPAGAEANRGRAAFLGLGCALCHTVRGTPAAGTLGPDLTHLASRRSLAADTLPMTRGALAAWIADPQAIKPHAQMPRMALSADDLNAVVAYLEGLE